MNTDQPYARDTDRQAPDKAPEATQPDPLAVHRDPSVNRAKLPRARNGIAWVRPSDLPTMLGSKVIGRGLDLKADLVRRANCLTNPKAPKARVTKTSIAKTPEAPGMEPPSITHQRPGGISL